MAGVDVITMIPRDSPEMMSFSEPDSDGDGLWCRIRSSAHIDQFKESDRGQSLIDFVLGVSLLLLVVTFAVGVVPTFAAPFDTETGGGASVATAERHADQLAFDVLPGSGGERYVLDPDCTKAVFDENATRACETESDRLGPIVGVDNRTSVNLTVTRLNGDTAAIDGVKLTTGSSPLATQDDVHTTVRVVSLGGSQHRLVYRIW